MKAPIAAVILAASALFTVALPFVSSGPTKSPVPLGSPGRTAWAFSATNATLPIDPHDVIHPVQSTRMPAPGVYVAQPYVMTVIVPRPTGDRCNPEGIGTSKMPTASPGLTLIPESEAGK
jgi:hypothetical protein